MVILKSEGCNRKPCFLGFMLLRCLWLISFFTKSEKEGYWRGILFFECELWILEPWLDLIRAFLAFFFNNGFERDSHCNCCIICLETSLCFNVMSPMAGYNRCPSSGSNFSTEITKDWAVNVSDCLIFPLLNLSQFFPSWLL